MRRRQSANADAAVPSARTANTRDFTSQRRRTLTIILILLACWSVVGAVIDLFFRSFVFTLDHAPRGVLAGRLFEGDLLVLALLWVIAAADPTRFRPLVWLAVLAQAIAIGSYVLHAKIGDLAWRGVWLPLVIAALFLAALLATMLTPNIVLRWGHALGRRRGEKQPAV